MTDLAPGQLRLPPARGSAALPLALTTALGGALAVRIAVSGTSGPGSLPAGLLFAVLVAAVAVLAGVRTRVTAAAFLLGTAGAAMLVAPVVVVHGVPDVHPAGSFLSWGAATAVVAVAEEALLRGALFDALEGWRGSDVAVVGAAVAFALMHVPLYGWHVVPLDLAVGLVLGALRLAAGTWAAPAVAHTGADLAGWWLV